MRRTLASARAGFTLLEVMIAFTLFMGVAVFTLLTLTDSYDQANGAERARQLRMLAESKLGEIAVFERHYDDLWDQVRFDDLPDELRNQFGEWTWSVEVRDVTVFGTQKDEYAPYLFPDQAPATDPNAQQGTGGTSGGTTQTRGETQILRELVLTVDSVDEDGAQGDGIEIVTYLPQVPARAAPAAGDGGTNK